MAIAGICLCGEVRFVINGELGAAGYCHCSDCRKVTGSAFGVSAPIQLDSLEILSGTFGCFTKRGASGNQLTRHFCAGCGSPVYTSSPRHPETIYIKCGVLDDPAVVKPALEAWTNSRVAWARIPEHVQSYPHGRGPGALDPSPGKD